MDIDAVSDETRRRAAILARMGVQVVAGTVLWVQVWLLVWSVLPMLAGWQPMVIVSSSMNPNIRVGDLVVVQPDPDLQMMGPGSIITFDDPDLPGRLVTHRITAVDGNALTTRGDANAADDPTPVPRSNVRGMARLLVPYMGLPSAWVAGGNGTAVGAWLGVTILAMLLSLAIGIREDAVADEAATVAVSAPVGRLRPTKRLVGVLLVLAAVLSGIDVEGSRAAFATSSATAANSWTADTDFDCARNPADEVADEDATVLQVLPILNTGSLPVLTVQSGILQNARTLINFPRIKDPKGCAPYKVLLRIEMLAVAPGRTLQVQVADGKWQENKVTWLKQPDGVGPVATAAATSGIVEFDITPLLVNDTRFGFIISDAAENGPAPVVAQLITAREGLLGSPAQIVYEYRAG